MGTLRVQHKGAAIDGDGLFPAVEVHQCRTEVLV
jgi:hypothetical protein